MGNVPAMSMGMSVDDAMVSGRVLSYRARVNACCFHDHGVLSLRRSPGYSIECNQEPSAGEQLIRGR